MLTSLRSLVSRVGPWPRRAAAVVCLALAALSAVDAHRPAAHPGGGSVAVTVAARALPVGHVLTRRDVTSQVWPRSLLAPGAFPASGPRRGEPPWLGRRVAAPLARGEPVTSRRLVGRDLTTGLAAGRVAVAVAVADRHVLELVHPGDAVDVLATDREPVTPTAGSGAAVVIAQDALVLGAFGVDGVGTDPAEAGGAGAEVVLAVGRDTATRLAGANSADVLTLVGHSP